MVLSRLKRKMPTLIAKQSPRTGICPPIATMTPTASIPTKDSIRWPPAGQLSMHFPGSTSRI